MWKLPCTLLLTVGSWTGLFLCGHLICSFVTRLAWITASLFWETGCLAVWPSGKWEGRRGEWTEEKVIKKSDRTGQMGDQRNLTLLSFQLVSVRHGGWKQWVSWLFCSVKLWSRGSWILLESYPGFPCKVSHRWTGKDT